ncbi:MAG: SCO family protein [Hyphomicrobiaceae bacterium]|nr:SCO family protein [Hyphomicrobiaceae bacterium]
MIPGRPSGTSDGAGGASPRAGTSGTVATTGKALVGGPFVLTDHTGKQVTDRDFRGRNMLVFFGFVNCPDICPAGLTVISAALDQLGKDAEQITPVFVTVDPERDTVAKMAEYRRSFHPRLVALTGTREEVAVAVKAYRVFAKKVPDERDPASYTVDHSSIAYLMGPDGQFRAFFAELKKPDQLAGELRKALAKP